MFFIKLFLLMFLFSPHVFADDISKYNEKSIEAIKKLGSSLKSSVKLAMDDVGPIGAIEYCNLAALDITREVSESLKLNIKRTSLKTRNKNNIPDSWEEKALVEFLAQYIAGKEIKNMHYQEIITTVQNKRMYRFIKPIPTGEVCLKCHGSNISSDLRSKIKELYPNDEAIGFKVGEIRGAFSVTMPLN